MKLRSLRIENQPELMIIPMIDIIFFLLVFFMISDQEEIPLSLLTKRVGVELTKQPDNVFVLRADKQVEYGKVITVLDELKLAGARRVSVATEMKGR